MEVDVRHVKGLLTYCIPEPGQVTGGQVAPDFDPKGESVTTEGNNHLLRWLENVGFAFCPWKIHLHQDFQQKFLILLLKKLKLFPSQPPLWQGRFIIHVLQIRI